MRAGMLFLFLYMRKFITDIDAGGNRAAWKSDIPQSFGIPPMISNFRKLRNHCQIRRFLNTRILDFGLVYNIPIHYGMSSCTNNLSL